MPAKTTLVAMGAALLFSIIPAAKATPITLSNNQLDDLIFTANAVYTVVANHGGEIVTGSTGFTSAGDSMAGPAVRTVASNTPLQFSGYSVPTGATLNWATLDLGTILTTTQALAYQMSGSGGTAGTWRPAFSSTSTAGFLTVTSGATSVILNAASVTGFDLIANGFSSHLLAGDPISIGWNQTISFTGSTSTTPAYAKNNWKDATRTFSLSQTNSVHAGGTLRIDYSTPPPPAAVPEPASLGLMGLGLLALARLRK